MKLEDIAKTYGMNDYYEQCTGRIYQLSRATENNIGGLDVPVLQDGSIIGYAKMEKINDRLQ